MHFDQICQQYPSLKILQLLKESPADNLRVGQEDFKALFAELWGDVSQSIDKTSATLPGYTPHNTQDHVTRLFRISEAIIGEETLIKLRPVELFALAVGLLAHDWGMRVTKEERMAIASQEEKYNPALHLLDDEFQRVLKSARRFGIRADKHNLSQKLDEENKGYTADERKNVQTFWLQYIRDTHAFRSKVRLINFFKKRNRPLANHLGEIAEAHWLDFTEFEKRHTLNTPAPSGATNEVFDVGLVALFVRITDLFDIGDDRTPMAALRSDPPEDERGRREWIKHSCIRPISIEVGVGERRVKVDGQVEAESKEPYVGQVVLADFSCAAPIIWAELEDLRTYCESQLRQAVEAIKKRLEGRGGFDLSPSLKWQVKPKGFRSSSMRFEFERRPVFQYLTTELYRGDAYVFIRELLQNAIDATTLRIAHDELNNKMEASHGVIYFNVVHHHDGDATVTCRDYGIGMDDYVVKNYLAITGRTYYGSADYKELDAQMTPISQFGIGILSCFMVSDDVTIETKSARLDCDNSPLKIKISSVNDYFQVFEGDPMMEPGTLVTVNVKRSFLKDQLKIRDPIEFANESGQPRVSPLAVTDYVRQIAGFVDYPIVIDEKPYNEKVASRTVIVHPRNNIKNANSSSHRQLPTLQQKAEASNMVWKGVYSLEPLYPWTAFCTNEDHISSGVLGQRAVSFVEDLKLAGHEGWLIFPCPADDRSIFKGAPESNHFASWSNATGLSSPIKLSFPPLASLFVPSDCDSESALRHHLWSVYQDGLLVARVPFPTLPHCWGSGLHPKIVVNLRKEARSHIRANRQELWGWSTEWAADFFNSLRAWLKSTIEAHLIQNRQSAKHALFDLIRQVGTFGLDAKWLLANLPSDNLPVPILKVSGGFDVITESDLPDELNEYPYLSDFEPYMATSMAMPLSRNMQLWRGEECCVPFIIKDTTNPSRIVWYSIAQLLGLDEFEVRLSLITSPNTEVAVAAQAKFKAFGGFKKKTARGGLTLVDCWRLEEEITQAAGGGLELSKLRIGNCLQPTYEWMTNGAGFLNHSNESLAWLVRCLDFAKSLPEGRSKVRITHPLGLIFECLIGGRFNYEEFEGQWIKLSAGLHSLGSQSLPCPPRARIFLGPSIFQTHTMPGLNPSISTGRLDFGINTTCEWGRTLEESVKTISN